MKYRDIITLVVALLFIISIPYGVAVIDIPFLFVIPLIVLILIFWYLWR